MFIGTGIGVDKLEDLCSEILKSDFRYEIEEENDNHPSNHDYFYNLDECLEYLVWECDLVIVNLDSHSSTFFSKSNVQNTQLEHFKQSNILKGHPVISSISQSSETTSSNSKSSHHHHPTPFVDENVIKFPQELKSWLIYEIGNIQSDFFQSQKQSENEEEETSNHMNGNLWFENNIKLNSLFSSLIYLLISPTLLSSNDDPSSFIHNENSNQQQLTSYYLPKLIDKCPIECCLSGKKIQWIKTLVLEYP